LEKVARFLRKGESRRLRDTDEVTDGHRLPREDEPGGDRVREEGVQESHQQEDGRPDAEVEASLERSGALDLDQRKLKIRS
jgi:hypothetical protein